MFFHLVWKSVFFCVLSHLCVHKTMQTCPSACFQRSYLSLLSLLIFFFKCDCRGGIFVTLCAGSELAYLLGRVTRRYCERVIISACRSTFCVRQICVWAAHTSHSCPTSASQCRCSSTDPAQQGSGRRPQSRPDLVTVRHAHHTRAQQTVDVSRWGYSIRIALNNVALVQLGLLVNILLRGGCVELRWLSHYKCSKGSQSRITVMANCNTDPQLWARTLPECTSFCTPFVSLF